MTDVGMTGSRDSIIGVKREQALEGFRTQMPVRFETATENVWVMGAAVDVGDDGLARAIEPVMVPVAS
jgi:calcineurin-like phosphoesterase